MSRFGEIGYHWRLKYLFTFHLIFHSRYSKEEGDDIDLRAFTHLITEKPHVPGFEKIDEIFGFAGIDLQEVKALQSEVLQAHKNGCLSFRDAFNGLIKCFKFEPMIFVHKAIK